MCLVLTLIRLVSNFSLFLHSPPTPLAHTHTSLCVCMCLITRGAPLPSACHMVHSFASFDMQRFKKVSVPVEFSSHFMVLQPEFRQIELRVVKKRQKITSNHEVI